MLTKEQSQFGIVENEKAWCRRLAWCEPQKTTTRCCRNHKDDGLVPTQLIELNCKPWRLIKKQYFVKEWIGIVVLIKEPLVTVVGHLLKQNYH